MRHLAATALVAFLPLGSCTSTDAPLVTAEGTTLRDAEGRTLLLRGVNARVEGLFDVTFDDGRLPLEEIPPFVEEDCRFLGEDLGMNHLRLPVNWSAIEPNDDDFREDYVAKILEVAAFCERHGVLTLVDLHQDAFSKEIGEDGAPLWAIQPPPTMLLGGPLDDLTARRLSQQVADAFDFLYYDRAGGWAAYAQMAAWLAERIEGRPGVVGLELMNEPQLLFNDTQLVAFHQHVAEAVRAAAPTLTVFFEPTAFRNISDTDAADPPFGFPNSAYSPHLYTDVFENGWQSEDVAAVQGSVSRMVTEAQTHGAALYVGEFGHDDSARGALYVETAIEAMDAARASFAYWLYEEWSQGSWGLYDATSSGGRIALRSARADLVARAYPVAVDATLVGFDYDRATRVLTVDLAEPGSREHVLAAPRRTYPDGVEVRCDGATVPARVEAGRAHARCQGASLELRPAL